MKRIIPLILISTTLLLALGETGCTSNATSANNDSPAQKQVNNGKNRKLQGTPDIVRPN